MGKRIVFFNKCNRNNCTITCDRMQLDPLYNHIQKSIHNGSQTYMSESRLLQENMGVKFQIFDYTQFLRYTTLSTDDKRKTK